MHHELLPLHVLLGDDLVGQGAGVGRDAELAQAVEVLLGQGEVGLQQPDLFLEAADLQLLKLDLVLAQLGGADAGLGQLRLGVAARDRLGDLDLQQVHLLLFQGAAFQGRQELAFLDRLALDHCQAFQAVARDAVDVDDSARRLHPTDMCRSELASDGPVAGVLAEVANGVGNHPK